MNRYHSLLFCASFLRILLDLDSRTLRQTQAAGCPWNRCRSRLDRADYARKPRGVLPELEKDTSKRGSLCCSKEGCRRRTTPPSVVFLGRRVYAGVAFILLSILRFGATDKRQADLRRGLQRELELRGMMSPDLSTLRRWRDWWRHSLPESPFWRATRGRLVRPVTGEHLPAGLLELCVGDPGTQMVALLRLLSPMSASSCSSWSGSAMVS
jgi:hypothetical protein